MRLRHRICRASPGWVARGYPSRLIYVLTVEDRLESYVSDVDISTHIRGIYLVYERKDRQNHSIWPFSAYKPQKSRSSQRITAPFHSCARKKVVEKCHNLTQNTPFVLYINWLRCVRFAWHSMWLRGILVSLCGRTYQNAPFRLMLDEEERNRWVRIRGTAAKYHQWYK